MIGAYKRWNSGPYCVNPDIKIEPEAMEDTKTLACECVLRGCVGSSAQTWKQLENMALFLGR